MILPPARAEVGDAAEVVHAGRGRVVLTCEHASNRLPAPWSWDPGDRWIVDTHWAWDLGAAAITRHLAGRLEATAVLARFTRLLVDPNRSRSSPTLFRRRADGRAIALNAAVDPAERARRIEGYYVPFHTAVDRAVERCPGATVLSIHSFTPSYEGGPRREMEVGVLFDRDDDLGEALAAGFVELGVATAVNAPYSGRNGMMYSAQSHALRAGRRAVELEIRQDIAGDASRHRDLVDQIVRALDTVALR